MPVRSSFNCLLYNVQYRQSENMQEVTDKLIIIFTNTLLVKITIEGWLIFCSTIIVLPQLRD